MMENQAKSSLSLHILQNKEQLLLQTNCLIAGHMGYVDAELMRLSTYNLYRAGDLEGITNPDVIRWVKENTNNFIGFTASFLFQS